MELLLTLNNVVMKYKDKMKKEGYEFLSVDSMLIIYLIKKGKNRLIEISRELGKDKSYVFRHLKKMEEIGLLESREKSYLITYRGNNMYTKINQINYIVKSNFKLKQVEIEQMNKILKKIENSI